MRRLAVVLLALAASLAHAQSRIVAYEAELEQKARRAETIAGGVRWTCSGTRCSASGRGGNVSVKGCSELARAVGPITRYRSEIKELAGADLQECNRIAQTPGGADAKGAKRPAKPQRATAPEISFTGIAAGSEPAQPERKP
jgi:hypothetical protein